MDVAKHCLESANLLPSRDHKLTNHVPLKFILCLVERGEEGVKVQAGTNRNIGELNEAGCCANCSQGFSHPEGI